MLILHYVRYNTVEPENNVRGSAVLILFERTDVYTASQATGPSVLRRSSRKLDRDTMAFMTHSVSQNESYARAMVILDEYLRVEERDKRYMPEIGFYS